jgi:hypothetical protein
MANFNFQKNNVHAGEPVTAQGWNDMVDGLYEVQAYLKAATGTVKVEITNAGFDPTTARVVALLTGAPPSQAINPITPSTDFIFPRLPAGSYEIHAEAPGFTTAVGTVTVSPTGDVSPQPLQLTLTASKTVMPLVLGKKLSDAVTTLGSIQARIVDTQGKDLPMQGFDQTHADSPIVSQYPQPGEFVPASGTMIVVAAPVQVEPFVLVPNLIGLTFAQAKAALDPLGLNITVQY